VVAAEYVEGFGRDDKADDPTGSAELGEFGTACSDHGGRPLDLQLRLSNIPLELGVERGSAELRAQRCTRRLTFHDDEQIVTHEEPVGAELTLLVGNFADNREVRGEELDLLADILLDADTEIAGECFTPGVASAVVQDARRDGAVDQTRHWGKHCGADID